MSSLAAIGLVVANLGLLYLLLAAPLGVRTITVRRRIAADRSKLWNAIFPRGDNAGWSGETLSVAPVPGEPDAVRVKLSWEGRDGLPIERTLLLDDVVEGERYSLTVFDDSSLDRAFWKNYRENGALSGEDGDILVTLSRIDRYRGAALFLFRYFVLRRELRKLKSWAETGAFRKGGLFEHPLSQVGFAVISALIFWPIFGLDTGGFVLAVVLTAVVALHELGHLAAFRVMGHRKVRMIFIPLLGGLAIGGRPYDSRFEVAFVALMGAGFSAFLVPIAIALSASASTAGHAVPSALFATLAGIAAIFNIANLVPVWKFDGGQVLRQICGSSALLAVASFCLLSAFLALGFLAGLPAGMLIFAGAIIALLSLITAGGTVKPRHQLKPIGMVERLAIAGAFVSVFAIHAYGVLWASERLV